MTQGRIGVGVEGPSDLKFWRKFLHRSFCGRLFDVRNMKNRSRLIRDTPRLLDMFRGLGYSGGIIILDRDKNPCTAHLVEEFDERVRGEFQKPLEQRYLQLCVAVRELESWFLADREAVLAVLPDASYDVPEDTSIWGAGRLRELWKQQYGRASALNKINFAEAMATRFSVARAMKHSASLQVSWDRVTRVVEREP